MKWLKISVIIIALFFIVTAGNFLPCEVARFISIVAGVWCGSLIYSVFTGVIWK